MTLTISAMRSQYYNHLQIGELTIALTTMYRCKNKYLYRFVSDPNEKVDYLLLIKFSVVSSILLFTIYRNFSTFDITGGVLFFFIFWCTKSYFGRINFCYAPNKVAVMISPACIKTIFLRIREIEIFVPLEFERNISSMQKMICFKFHKIEKNFQSLYIISICLQFMKIDKFLSKYTYTQTSGNAQKNVEKIARAPTENQ